ncbi:hypothetical protein Pmani_033355 [Petrolisthes manimaculis]|uniref:Uncharacterized protein n=1 Tax=Petrolisthes manimaculis TaxID=1843537 RepID=A0AAE1TQI2_9EUCA|nr:hypothetical protein Pmani_033355 [Petrolisthes manimaculis]
MSVTGREAATTFAKESVWLWTPSGKHVCGSLSRHRGHCSLAGGEPLSPGCQCCRPGQLIHPQHINHEPPMMTNINHKQALSHQAKLIRQN